MHDLLRRLGDLDADEVAARVRGTDSQTRRRVARANGSRHCRPIAVPSRIRIAGEARWIAIEDAGRYRDATGAAPPRGVPEDFLGPTHDAAGDRCWLAGRDVTGRSMTAAPAARWQLPHGVVESALEGLMAAGVTAPWRVPARRCGTRVV